MNTGISGSVTATIAPRSSRWRASATTTASGTITASRTWGRYSEKYVVQRVDPAAGERRERAGALSTDPRRPELGHPSQQRRPRSWLLTRGRRAAGSELGAPGDHRRARTHDDQQRRERRREAARARDRSNAASTTLASSQAWAITSNAATVAEPDARGDECAGRRGRSAASVGRPHLDALARRSPVSAARPKSTRSGRRSHHADRVRNPERGSEASLVERSHHQLAGRLGLVGDLDRDVGEALVHRAAGPRSVAAARRSHPRGSGRWCWPLWAMFSRSRASWRAATRSARRASSSGLSTTLPAAANTVPVVGLQSARGAGDARSRAGRPGRAALQLAGGGPGRRLQRLVAVPEAPAQSLGQRAAARSSCPTPIIPIITTCLYCGVHRDVGAAGSATQPRRAADARGSSERGDDRRCGPSSLHACERPRMSSPAPEQAGASRAAHGRAGERDDAQPAVRRAACARGDRRRGRFAGDVVLSGARSYQIQQEVYIAPAARGRLQRRGAAVVAAASAADRRRAGSAGDRAASGARRAHSGTRSGHRRGHPAGRAPRDPAGRDRDDRPGARARPRGAADRAGISARPALDPPGASRRRRPRCRRWWRRPAPSPRCRSSSARR